MSSWFLALRAPARPRSLARALASQLRLPLFWKDHIKETLIDALGGLATDLECSRRVGGAAMELVWRLIEEVPAAVLEANSRPHSHHERRRLASLDACVVEVYRDCPPSEVARRFAARAAAGVHAAHPRRTLPDDLLAEYDRPVGIGTVLRVDTRQPVDVAVVAAQDRQAHVPFAPGGRR